MARHKLELHCLGLMYFLLITFEKLSDHLVDKECHEQNFYRMLTLLTVMLGWILFRAIGLRRAISYVLSIIGANDNPLHGNITNLYLKENIFVLLIAIIIATPILLISRKIWLKEI